jgi:hypothetical protein
MNVDRVSKANETDLIAVDDIASGLGPILNSIP